MKLTNRILIILFLLQTGLLCRGQNNNFQISIYDNLKYKTTTDDQKTSLNRLNDKKIFELLNNRLILKLPEKHQKYFKSKNYFKLLFSIKGDIFTNKKEDFAFVVFDEKRVIITILIYTESTNQYLELYRDIKVQNDLIGTDCYSSAFRTLDYQICNEIIYQEDYLIKEPESLSSWGIGKITNINQDKDFVLDDGCFPKNYTKSNLPNFNSLCISTSITYNNWECLRYDRVKNIFILFYSQAFAD
jgi:hypothetical protein